MHGYTKFLETLIQELSRLAEAIVNAKQQTRKCRLCNYFAEADECPICQSKDRRDKVICVVEDPQDVIAIERTGRYSGLYHVLWGKLSPLEGTGPADLPVKKLLYRLEHDNIKEVIIATSSNREAETTAQYLKHVIAPLKIRVTRIARGIPVGSNIGHIDKATISEALDGRREVSA